MDKKGLLGELKISFFYFNVSVKEKESLFFEKKGNILGPYEISYLYNYKFNKNGKKIYVLKLCGVNNISESEIFVKSFVLKKFDILPENVFITSELERCEVFDSANNKVGEVKSVIKLKKLYSLLAVQSYSGKEIFIPFTKNIVNLVDIKNRKIVLNDIPGILEQ